MGLRVRGYSGRIQGVWTGNGEAVDGGIGDKKEVNRQVLKQYCGYNCVGIGRCKGWGGRNGTAIR